jgi:hypothetical protein
MQKDHRDDMMRAEFTACGATVPQQLDEIASQLFIIEGKGG